jgi:hypothetical protein
MRLVTIALCITGIIGAMHTNNPVPLKVMAVSLAILIIISNAQEL